MNNFEIDEQAKTLSDQHSAYALARMLLEANEKLSALGDIKDNIQEKVFKAGYSIGFGTPDNLFDSDKAYDGWKSFEIERLTKVMKGEGDGQ